MSYRSTWKGFLKLALITCPVKLYAATSEPDKVSFTHFNRFTGNRIKFKRVDQVTAEEVEWKDIAKGVEIAAGRYAEVTEEEIAAAAPRSAAVVEIQELVPPAGIGWLFPDAHYYLGPDGLAAGEAFALMRDGLARSRMVALGQLSLGTREHVVMLKPGRKVLKLSTLRYAAEIREEDACFPKLVDVAAPEHLSEMVDAVFEARRNHEFDPGQFTDRYAEALADLVKAKISGTMVKRTTLPPPRLIDLAKAVKRSAGVAGKPDKRSKRGRAA